MSKVEIRKVDQDFAGDPSSSKKMNNNVIYPRNALLDLDIIRQAVSGKRPVIFLDYDGTLSPIVDIPDKAYMTQDMRSAVQKVSSRYLTAIVTGRACDKVYNFVQLDNLVYAGSHGFDIKGPPTIPVKNQVGDDFRHSLQTTMQRLAKQIAHIEGAAIEDNRYAISIHFRNVELSLHKEIEEIVDLEIANYSPQLIKTYGKKVYELRPRLDWNKGRAVMWILASLGLEVDDVIPFYFGDDISDEDAFKALLERTVGQGIGILVRDPNSPNEDFPGNAKEFPVTSASYSLRNTHEVQSFLEILASEQLMAHPEVA